MHRKNPLESLFWCIAFPGFGQILNGHYFKGTILIVLEFVINMRARLNTTIIDSFQGQIQLAIEHADYQWLMFYPCVYMFGIWDAYKYAGGGKSPNATYPFVFCAFFATVGVMFSANLLIAGMLLGPVWLPMLFALIGVFFGLGIKLLLDRMAKGPV